MDLWTELMAMPTAIFSIGVALTVLYWLLFLIGSLDLDVLGGADGALEGVEGAVDGAVEGAAEGAIEGAAEGAAEGAVGLVHALKLRSVPATVALSFFVLIGWVTSYVVLGWLAPLLPGWLAGTLTFIASVVAGVFGTSLAVRPFAKLFVDHKVTRLKDLVGKVVIITTGRVDERFGQARCDTADALILEVRAKKGSPLTRNDAALLIDYDAATRTFTVEPADPLLVLERPRSAQ